MNKIIKKDVLDNIRIRKGGSARLRAVHARLDAVHARLFAVHARPQAIHARLHAIHARLQPASQPHNGKKPRCFSGVFVILL